MIYFLAEFCLNSLNGPFFNSVDKLQLSTESHARFAPLVSIYVLIFGFNTVNVSVVFSQLLCLYNLFESIDKTSIRLVKNMISYDDSRFERLVMKLITNIFMVPLFISLILNGTYITKANKCNSLLSRILYTLSSHIAKLVVKDFIIVKISEFTLSFIVNSLFSKFYLLSELKTSALIFSFIGTYFFLKTHSKNNAFAYLAGREFEFSFNLSELPPKNVLESSIAFLLLFLVSFMSQILVRNLVLKIAKKAKRD